MIILGLFLLHEDLPHNVLTEGKVIAMFITLFGPGIDMTETINGQ